MKVTEITDEAVRKLLKNQKSKYKPVGRRLEKAQIHYTQVLCLGDSITFGARCVNVRGYPPVLEELLTSQAGFPYVCINAGVSGENSSEIQFRAWRNMNNFFIKVVCLIMGTNDAKPVYRIPSEVFSRNLLSIIRYSKCLNQRLIVGMTPQIYPGRQDEYDIESPIYAARYRFAIKEICKMYEIETVPLESILDEHEFADGIHPNTRGYEEIARAFADKILQP